MHCQPPKGELRDRLSNILYIDIFFMSEFSSCEPQGQSDINN